MKSVLAADLGGTKCRVALVTEDNQVLGAQRLPTSRDRSVFLPALEQAFANALAERPAAVEPPQGIGIGTAGVITADGRGVERAPNLPLDNFALAAHFEAKLSLPTSLLNDGRASAWGEFRTGTGRGLDPLLCLFFGTGIGIGIMAGGKPHQGADNAAGEIGHTIWQHGGRRCPCGGHGHFEAYCGGRAILERSQDLLGPNPNSGPWTAATIAALNNPAATAILDDAALAASICTANACTLWNPRAVVLGGGLIEGWPALAERIESYVRMHCSAAITRRLQFHRSAGGSDAILIGAAASTGCLRA
jgi:glucokinase